MRAIALLLALAGLTLPALAARHVTVEQLEKTLAQTEAKSDADVARLLSELQLTERLSRSRLLQLSAGLPGEKARQAMLLLADTSAFLAPPAAEIPGTATPDTAAQKRMMALTMDYLGKSLPLLPNLFANRDTIRFESRAGSPVSSPEGAESPGAELRAVSHSSVIVLYRDNQEFVAPTDPKTDKPRSPDRGLTTWGEFGPIMGTVMIDAALNKLAWSHWEMSEAGPEAVFRYAVAKEKSHYNVRFCCVSESYGMEVNEVRQRTGYHGEITVDPDDGAILRLTLIADLDATDPISRASIAVEYAPEEIGGKTYICPVRGVAFAQAPDAKSLHKILYPANSDKALPPLQKASLPVQPIGERATLLNDVAFRHYHLFRVESRIVPEKDLAKESTENPGSTSPAPAEPAAADAGATPFSNAKPAEEVAEANMAAPAHLAGQPAPPGESATSVDTPRALPVVPEIGVEEAAGLPETPAIQQSSSPDSGFTLHISSRLVDMNVVAVDKKGRPVVNLKPEDFEVYDDGKKVDIRSFEQAGAAIGKEPAESAQPQPAADQPAFSNHRLNDSKHGNTERNTIVLLVDGANLAFNDFANARQQMVEFLKTLQGNEPVALYALKGHGFQILEEGSTDHAAIAAKLAKWMPSAADLSNAQDEEQRNRQQIETVHNPEDLLSVNGNFVADTGAQSEALDPKLRELGSNPSGNALSILVDVARHLATVPGHKSLVWVTSDNVLVDWSMMSVSIEKGSKYIEPFALRVQETMNNSHVSVYPLDASILEGSVADAGIGRRNVELTPTYQRNLNAQTQATEHEMEGPEMNSATDPNPYGQGRDLRPGRLTAQMQQDMRPIQGVFREIATATGGEALRRSNNIVGQLNGVDADGRATYLLSFTPAQQADNQYHLLTVKLPGRKDVTLRYRTGYQYEKDPSSLKERFAKVVWQPTDATDISLSATPSAADKTTFKLNIAANDLAMAQSEGMWTDKVGIFLVRRDDSGLRAQITGETLNLKLKPGTYQKLLREGIPFDQIVEPGKGSAAVKIVVVDENSGRMGTLTVPAVAAKATAKPE